MIFEGQHNVGLNLNWDIQAQEKTKAHGRQKLSKLKIAKRFEDIIYGRFIFEVANSVIY